MRDRRFYAPENLGELAQLLKREDTVIYSGGGSYLMDRQSRGESRLAGRPPEPPIVALHRVEELRKIARSERYAEIGSATSLQRIIGVGRKFLPSALLDALRQAGPFLVRNSATFGGTLAVPTHIFGVHLVLQLLDARVEIRGQKGSEWIGVARLRDPQGSVVLEPGELVTRVRIPLDHHSAQLYRQFGDGYGTREPPLAFAGIASVVKESIDRVQLGYLCNSRTLLRLRDAEAQLTGAKLPLQRKLLLSFLDALASQLDTVDRLTRLQRARALNLSQQFLSGLDAG
ncbi:MAG: FAD binding domain-containing protein [Alkalispirochaetaceae bacterium]